MDIQSKIQQYNNLCQNNEPRFEDYASSESQPWLESLSKTYVLEPDETPMAYCTVSKYSKTAVGFLLTDRHLYMPSSKKTPMLPVVLEGITCVAPWYKNSVRNLLAGCYVYYHDGSYVLINRQYFQTKVDESLAITLRILTLMAAPDLTPVSVFPKISIGDEPIDLKSQMNDENFIAMIARGDSASFNPAYDELYKKYGAKIFAGFRRDIPQALYAYHNCFLPNNLPEEIKKELPMIAPDVPMKEICLVCTNASGKHGMTTGIVVTSRALYYRFHHHLDEFIPAYGFLPLDGLTGIITTNDSTRHYVVTYANGMLRPLDYAGDFAGPYLPDLIRAIGGVLETCHPFHQDDHLDIQAGLRMYYHEREKEGFNAYHNSFFVSSTFKDMHYERDTIHDRILPALNKLGAIYGQSISFCDLRWGVDTGDLDSAEGARKVLTVCLDEIERCKPHMVILLGSRYGWIPDQELIAETLVGRDDFFLEDLEKSVTALEIEFGALSKAMDRDRIFVYFRTLEGSAADEYLAEDAYHAEKLEALKERIRVICGDRIRHYQLTFDNKGKIIAGMDEFSSVVLDDLEQSLRKTWEAEAELSPMEQECRLHADYAGRKALQCNARENLLLDLASRIDKGESFLAICGPSGSGKSTVMAALSYIIRYSGAEALPLFCGLTGNSDQAQEILKLILYTLETRLQLEHFQPNDFEDSQMALRRKLNEVAKAYRSSDQPRLVIMIDAVDQLLEDSLRDSLRFLPDETDRKLSIVLSCTDDFRIPYGPLVIEMPAPESIEAIVRGILKLHRRELESPVLEAIAAKEGADRPLYISLLMERLLMMNKVDFDAIINAGDGMDAISMHQCRLIDQAPDDLNSMGAALLSEAASRIDGPIVDEATAYLAASRHGLRDTDLEQLFRRKGLPWNALNLSLYLHYIAGLFLFRTDGRIDFSHKSLREGFQALDLDPIGRHREIVQHLESLPEGDPLKETELFYHTVQARETAALYTYIEQMSEDQNRQMYIARQLSDACQLPDSHLLEDLLHPDSDQMPGPGFLIFMSKSFYNYYARFAEKKALQQYADQLIDLARRLFRLRQDQRGREALIQCLECCPAACRSSQDKEVWEKAKNCCLELIEYSDMLNKELNQLYISAPILYGYECLAIYRHRLQEPQASVQEAYEKAAKLADILYPDRRQQSVRTRRRIGIAYSNLLFGAGVVPPDDCDHILQKAQSILEENVEEIGTSNTIYDLAYFYEDVAYYYRNDKKDLKKALFYFQKEANTLKIYLKEDDQVSTLKKLANNYLSMAVILKKEDEDAHQQEILSYLESANGYYQLYCKEARTNMASNYHNVLLTWTSLAQAYQKANDPENKQKCCQLLNRVIPQVKEMLAEVSQENRSDVLDRYCTLLDIQMRYTSDSDASVIKVGEELMEVYSQLHRMTREPVYKELHKILKRKLRLMRIANVIR